ncbi:hypothetical protein PISL3812_06608 [Talaromyces islandicus]|uniref:cyclin-dependent kinase n=1 Tax=Talaromyces islandicus TaxID=28573 RepID=A0A0U1M3K2_TALIS|nr:hypothetical protein PISL3812_06608 [Talaromyces islandicus]
MHFGLPGQPATWQRTRLSPLRQRERPCLGAPAALKDSNRPGDTLDVDIKPQLLFTAATLIIVFTQTRSCPCERIFSRFASDSCLPSISTSAYRKAAPSASFAEAQAHAKRYESEAYGKAASKVEYDQLWEQVIDEVHAQHSVAPVIDSPEVQPDYEEEQPQEGAVTIGKYQHCHHHDDGLLSTIYRAKNDDGALVALKVTTPHLMGPPHDSKREVRLLREAASSHVIPMLEAFDLAGGRLILVFPFMKFNMNELLRQDILTPSQIKSHLRDMFTALECVHGLGIIHRDVKPSNILLESPSGPAYLSDFGIAWKEGDAGSEPSTQKITDVGTTCYRPPEILFGSRDYNTTLDLWAAGCVVAEVLDAYHSQLFDAGPLGSELALIQSIFTTLGTPDTTVWPESVRLPDWGKFEFYKYPAKPWEEIIRGASSQGRDLVGQLVRYESASRLTAAGALEHPFFSA